MQIIISPAKKMRVDLDSFPVKALPQFMSQTEALLACLRELSYEELKALWKCSDTLAKLNQERLQDMDLYHNLTPAILAYEGIQYQHIAPNVFTEQALRYVQDHLRILTGFYGIVRPFDGVVPYRLEMQSKLKIGEAKDLYSYWGKQLAEHLFSETGCIVNLASKEYSLCISRYLSKKVRFITCIFGERSGAKIVEKGTLCKMARGEMVRFLADMQAGTPEDIQQFKGLGYHFSPQDSSDTTFVFVKER